MYDYRRMTPTERAAVIAERYRRGHPWHSPPHFAGPERTFLISAACYGHQPILSSPARLSEFTEALLNGLKSELAVAPQAWVFLPNHYHVVAELDLDLLRPWLGRLHNGKSTQWNREDGAPGRKVWHRFSDRAIRSERHLFTTLNYVHGNPVKHRYVQKADDWPWCSVHEFLEQHGRETLVEWWKEYPVRHYGRGWDD